MSLSDTLRDVERKTINAMGAPSSTELRFLYAGHQLKDTSHPLEMYHFRNDTRVYVVELRGN